MRGVDVLLLVAAAVSAFAAVVVTRDGVRAFRRGGASRSWPAVTGVVRSSDVREEDGSYAPVVTYTYVVDGTEHEGSRIFFGDSVAASREWAESWAGRYRAGDRVRVCYDPSDPRVSALEAGRRWQAYLGLVAGPAVLGFAVLLAVAGWLRLVGR